MPKPASFKETLRRRRLEMEAKQVRDSIVAGYRDAIAGRTIEFN